MAWDVELIKDAEKQLKDLRRRDRTRMVRQIDKLRRDGPRLGRPDADSISGSRHNNMKELRVTGTPIRALFAFGPDRRAIVLTVGSKAGNEKRWYREATRTADRLFDQHLLTLRGGSACRATGVGRRSAARQM